MRQYLALALALCTAALSAENLLLDNFNDGGETNALGHFWYYYSDVNDSGNSVIHHATPRANGAFSRVRTVPRDSTGDLCAVIEYTLGDTLCLHWGSDWDHVAFVGIGTDIGTSNAPVALQHIDSISFEARSFPATATIIELVHAHDDPNYNNSFFREMFLASSEWKKITIPICSFMQPKWTQVTELIKLNNVIKINWRIAAITTAPSNNDSGAFFIDNVVLHGVEKIPGFMTSTMSARPITTIAAEKFDAGSRYDFLGRKIARRSNTATANGIYIYRTSRSWKPGIMLP